MYFRYLLLSMCCLLLGNGTDLEEKDVKGSLLDSITRWGFAEPAPAAAQPAKEQK